MHLTVNFFIPFSFGRIETTSRIVGQCEQYFYWDKMSIKKFGCPIFKSFLNFGLYLVRALEKRSRASGRLRQARNGDPMIFPYQLWGLSVFEDSLLRVNKDSIEK